MVKVKSGRDKDGFCVVKEVHQNCVFVVDGKRRTLLKPKSKNKKHLSLTNTVLVDESLKTDKSIRGALKNFQ